ncbi:MAG: hypothetical protein Tsb0015_10780 [Simkaniaceae bacterium]
MLDISVSFRNVHRTISKTILIEIFLAFKIYKHLLVRRILTRFKKYYKVVFQTLKKCNKNKFRALKIINLGDLLLYKATSEALVIYFIKQIVAF